VTRINKNGLVLNSNLCFVYFILGLRLKKSVPKTNVHNYFSINVLDKKLFLHKATATWYLQDRQSRLSCDRVQRVRLQN
jgi:hypothetical protein